MRLPEPGRAEGTLNGEPLVSPPCPLGRRPSIGPSAEVASGDKKPALPGSLCWDCGHDELQGARAGGSSSPKWLRAGAGGVQGHPWGR